MRIVLAKTIGGDFLIGKSGVEGKESVITDVYNIITYPDKTKTNQLVTALIPIMYPFEESGIKEISKDKLLAVIDAPEDLERLYIKITTGLDIVAPNNKIIQ